MSQQHAFVGEELRSADDSGTFRRPTLIPRVAVIDDEVMITKVVARCLHPKFQVHTHNRGETALDWLSDLALASMAPDLVLCDLSLGAVSGVDLFYDIARELPWLAPRVVFLTGGSCSSRDDAFLAAREASTLRKPFTPDVLREWVRRRVDPLFP